MRGVEARIVRTRSSLALEYAIEGRIEELRVPAPKPPRFAERLWQHTCCEVFVARTGSSGYLEFNFSPSGEWAGYAFERYRNGAAFEAPDPKIALRVSPARLELEASIQVQPGRLLLALSASLAWGVADFVGPWQGRRFGVLRVMLWSQVGGVALLAIVTAARGTGPHEWAVLWAVPAAFSGTLGLVAFYRGMATGTMSVVAPIGFVPVPAVSTAVVST